MTCTLQFTVQRLASASGLADRKLTNNRVCLLSERDLNLLVQSGQFIPHMPSVANLSNSSDLSLDKNDQMRGNRLKIEAVALGDSRCLRLSRAGQVDSRRCCLAGMALMRSAFSLLTN